MDYQANPGLTPGERLIRIEEILGGLQQNLFGNGQPGVIAELTGRIGLLEKSDAARVANAGGQRTIWTLLLVIATLAVSVIGLFLSRH